MKIVHYLTSLLVILCLTGIQSNLSAQDMDEDYRRWSISVNGGSTLSNNFSGLSFFHSDLNRETVATGKFGVGVEYALFPLWSLGLDYGNTSVEGVDESFTTDVNSFGLKNYFNLNRLYAQHDIADILNPFLTFGFGFDSYSYESAATEFDETDSYLSFGLGLGVSLSESIELFGQMDYHLGGDRMDNREQEYYRSLLTQATAGIRLHFGPSGSKQLKHAPARMYMSEDRYNEIMGQQDMYTQAQQRTQEQEAEIDRLNGEISDLQQQANRGGICCRELAALRDSLANAAVITPELEQIVIGALNGVVFEFDRSELLAVSRAILNNAATMLNYIPDVEVVIEGHTDSIGSEEYNMALSLRRAQAVRDYLISRGIDESRMTLEGFGESQPIADNNTEEGRAMNRRVVFSVVD